MFLCLCVTPLRPQVAASFQAFLGSWRAVCADGKDFVIVVLEQNADASMGGSVQLANMSGGDDGSCAMVIDPPSEKHALKVGDGRLEGGVLQFTGSRKLHFEMSVTGASAARLSVIGTASEERPWELRRSK